MKNLLIITILTILLSIGHNAQAQNYQAEIRKAENHIRNGNYKKALKSYFAAEAQEPAKKKEVQKKIEDLMDKVNRLKQQAETALNAVEAKTKKTIADLLSRYEIIKARAELQLLKDLKRSSRAEIARWERRINDSLRMVTPEMVTVEGGSFEMGYDSLRDGVDKYMNVSKLHAVTLSSYSIAKTEVTQAFWEKIWGKNSSFFKPPTKEACPDCPVESVSWNDIQEFLVLLKEKTGQTFRLPTEAEWEFAARGGNKSKGYKYAGSDSLNLVAWSQDNSRYETHPVAQKTPNELGLYDMSGNVWEWCQDRSGAYPKEAKPNPAGPAIGSNRLFRGGSWDVEPQRCRSAYRNLYSPDSRSRSLGFRLAGTLNF